MGKSDYEYLDEERRKLWHKVNAVETELHHRISDELSKIPEDYVSESRQASKKVSEFKNKSEEAKNTINQFLNESEAKRDAILQVALSVSTTNSEIKHASEEIIENGNKVKVIVGEVEDKKISIGSSVSKLEELFEDFDELNEKLTKLDEIASNVDDTSSKIEVLHKSLLNRRKDIDQLYYEIFGYSQNEGGVESKIPGLKDELDRAYNELENNIKSTFNKVDELKVKANTDYQDLLLIAQTNFKDNIETWETKYTSLEERIQALLPNALTAGLSSAYSEKKSVEIEEYNNLNKSFLISIGCLVLVSLIPLGVSYYSLTHDKPFEKVLLDMPRLVLSILPLYIPVLWVAYSSNRKMNLSKRLSEEYSHKEVLSKTFEGLSNQINNISDEKVSSDLRNKLLYNILEVSSENPGKLISDYNKSDHPLMDALDKSVQLATAFEKLEKIPGFSKLADKLNKKSKTILNEEEEKANKGLNTLDVEDEA